MITESVSGPLRTSRASNLTLAAAVACATAFLILPAATTAMQIDVTPKDRPRVQPKSTQIVVPKPRLEFIKPPAGVTVTAAGSDSLGGGAGEIQSAVVPPGKKSQCPNGRVLISNDSSKNPASVFQFDFTGVRAASAGIKPEALPDPVNQRIASNDHDLVALVNGDVLLLKMGQSKAPLTPEPVWFDSTYKLTGCDADTGVCTGAWGPGARSVIYVWRSEDCGDTFSFRASIDTARVNDGWGTQNDGSGGLPQQLSGFANGLTTSPGSPEQPAWQMGGSDGPLAKVDLVSGRIFYSMRLAGRKPLGGVNNFMLGDLVGRSVVMMSDDRGDSWTEATTLTHSTWRTPIATMGANRLAFLHGRAQGMCTQANNFACYIYYDTAIGSNLNPSSEPDEGATRLFYAPNEWTGVGRVSEEDKSLTADNLDTNISANVVHHKLLSRIPDSKGALMVFTQKAQTGGSGYAMYSLVSGGFIDGFPQIAPASRVSESFILHPTVVDLGVGPVFFYWYDVNAAKGTMQVRGRFVTGASEYTDDFNISGLFGTPEENTWFGDYHTADGYSKLPQLKKVNSRNVQLKQPGERPQVYEFFPVWKHSDGSIRFARVTYEKPTEGAEDDGHRKFEEKARAMPEILPPDFTIIEVEPVEQEYPQQ